MASKDVKFVVLWLTWRENGADSCAHGSPVPFVTTRPFISFNLSTLGSALEIGCLQKLKQRSMASVVKPSRHCVDAL